MPFFFFFQSQFDNASQFDKKCNIIVTSAIAFQVQNIYINTKINCNIKKSEGGAKIMADNKKVINIKLDEDTKSKFETLAFIKRSTLQDLCIELINQTIEANADKIAEAEKLRE